MDAGDVLLEQFEEDGLAAADVSFEGIDYFMHICLIMAKMCQK